MNPRDVTQAPSHRRFEVHLRIMRAEEEEGISVIYNQKFSFSVPLAIGTPQNCKPVNLSPTAGTKHIQTNATRPLTMEMTYKNGLQSGRTLRSFHDTTVKIILETSLPPDENLRWAWVNNGSHTASSSSLLRVLAGPSFADPALRSAGARSAQRAHGFHNVAIVWASSWPKLALQVLHLTEEATQAESWLSTHCSNTRHATSYPKTSSADDPPDGLT
ncbi:hypothetical protein BV25DRAFT_1963527 [Artomyces pyxidatus]|uniref:Uncharacterized protein n=1 Tax=Artomyces pyxidatus TaxID=48021 RepID=A0ACB8SSX2_9AGAM|nr:hypothetical protein BV25DRAFT_1963527 [Artomyces pyxidatus]